MKHSVKQIVKKHYSAVAVQNESECGGCGCGCGTTVTNEQIAKRIGYSDQEIKSAAAANLGLGCGNPTGLGKIKEGDTVLDLGSGAGFDCFLAAQLVKASGRMIGVDISEDMIARAKINADKYGYSNVEFRLGDVEQLPIEDESVDIIISNCVINLAPDKAKVFSEARRVLKKGGKMYISDIVLLKALSREQSENEELLVGCVAGAILKNDYLDIIKQNGLSVTILSEDKEISKRQYQGIPLESLKIEVQK